MKVGLIGAGRQGKRRARALKDFADTELVIVADIEQEPAESLAKEMGCQSTTDWQKVTSRKDIDAVIICTPPNLHGPMCLSAFSESKHVLCEKPLAHTPEEAQALVRAAQEKHLKLKSGFNLRHHPAISLAKKYLDEGKIGEPIFLRCRYGIGGREGYEKEWRMNPDISGGGQLTDQGMHTLDLARWFLGEFQEVSGFTQTGFWDIAPLEDNVYCLLRTAKGRIATIHASWTQWKNLFSLEVFGKDGYVTVEGLGGSYGVEKLIFGKREFGKPFEEETTEFRGEDHSWQEEWREFARRHQGRPGASGQRLRWFTGGEAGSCHISGC